jgi:hypothetical protein
MAPAPEPSASPPGEPALAEPPPVVADAAAPASAAQAASAVEGFVWPKATRVSYLLTGNWRGELNGRAEVEWIKIDDRYQVIVAMHAGPEFAPLVARRMMSEGRIVEGGLAPERYEEETKVGDARRPAGEHGLRAGFGDPRQRPAACPASPACRTREPVHPVHLDVRQPARAAARRQYLRVPLALPRSMNVWVYDVAEEEVMHTAIGPLKTFT